MDSCGKEGSIIGEMIEFGKGNGRSPKCTRCRNHGVINDLRGHKHKCPWKECTCDKCLIVAEKQRVTAARIALYRQQVADSNTNSFNEQSISPHSPSVIQSRSAEKDFIQQQRGTISVSPDTSTELQSDRIHLNSAIFSSFTSGEPTVEQNQLTNHRPLKRGSHSPTSTSDESTGSPVNAYQLNRKRHMEVLKYIFPFYSPSFLESVLHTYNDSILPAVLSICRPLLFVSNSYDHRNSEGKNPQHGTQEYSRPVCCSSPYCPAQMAFEASKRRNSPSYWSDTMKYTMPENTRPYTPKNNYEQWCQGNRLNMITCNGIDSRDSNPLFSPPSKRMRWSAHGRDHSFDQSSTASQVDKESLKFCTSCKKIAEKDDKFCSLCGVLLDPN